MPHTPLTGEGGQPVYEVIAVKLRYEPYDETSPPGSAMSIMSNHPIFSTPVLPISDRIGVPLVMHKIGTTSPSQTDLDDEMVISPSTLSLDPTSGCVPPEWDSYEGTVLVARKDRKPLLRQHLEVYWKYSRHIAWAWQEFGDAPASMYNREDFEEYWWAYVGLHLGEPDAYKWDGLESPYEM